MDCRQSISINRNLWILKGEIMSNSQVAEREYVAEFQKVSYKQFESDCFSTFSSIFKSDNDSNIDPNFIGEIYNTIKSYNIDSFHYTERWYECPKCGMTTKI